MKFKALLTVLATITLGLIPAIGAEEDTPLTKEMTAMNKSLRMLKRQIVDTSKKTDNLALVGKIKANLAAAIKLQPAKTKDIPEAEKAAYLAKFKEQLTELTKTYDAMEAAIKADKIEDAKNLFEKLAEQKEKGHKDFGVDDE